MHVSFLKHRRHRIKLTLCKVCANYSSVMQVSATLGFVICCLRHYYWEVFYWIEHVSKETISTTGALMLVLFDVVEMKLLVHCCCILFWFLNYVKLSTIIMFRQCFGIIQWRKRLITVLRMDTILWRRYWIMDK